MAKATPTIHQSALNGARTSRYGDVVLIVMESIAFFTTAQELQIASQWARSKQSLGNPNKDRTAFAARFETLIARNGAGIQTRGSNKVLSVIVQAMETAGMDVREWSVPHNINESMEVKKQDKDQEAGADEATPEEPKPAA